MENVVNELESIQIKVSRVDEEIAIYERKKKTIDRNLDMVRRFVSLIDDRIAKEGAKMDTKELNRLNKERLDYMGESISHQDDLTKVNTILSQLQNDREYFSKRAETMQGS